MTPNTPTPLLACPRCNSLAGITFRRDFLQMSGTAVETASCECSPYISVIVPRQPWDDGSEHLIAAWNTRPQPASAGVGEVEIERAKAERDRLLYGSGYMLDGVRIDPARISILPAPASVSEGEDARDAARYRWIREQQRRHGTMVALQGIVWNNTDRKSFDAAIDRALSAAKVGR